MRRRSYWSGWSGSTTGAVAETRTFGPAGLLFITAKIIVLSYLGFGLLLFLAQNAMIYMPVAESSSDRLAFEYLQSDGESIKIWVVQPGNDRAVIYFGGNAEDVRIYADDFQRALPNQTVYLVNYRGYGGSSGKPSQQNLLADALQIYDQLSERHRSIAVVGRSLGSGVATYLASRREVQRLLLATPYDSVLALAQSRYPVYPVSLLLRDTYKSIEWAPLVRAKTLILMAELDQLIPTRHSLKLAEAFSDDLVSTAVIEQADHNGLGAYPQYWMEISGFLGSSQ